MNACRALWHRRQAVAQPRRLAGEREPSSGPQHAVKLVERAAEVGEVVEHRVAEHEVEALVGERQRLGIRAGRADIEAQALRIGRQRSDHPRRDVSARRLAHGPCLQQVQAEVARACTDLERPAEATVELSSEQLAELPEHLSLSDGTEVDSPLGVVAFGCHIVVASVDVPDLVGAAKCLHGGGDITLSPCQ